MSTSLRTSAATSLIFFALGSGISLAQTVKTTALPVSPNRTDSAQVAAARQSLVDARLAPERTDESRINDVYQEVVKVHLQGDYSEAADMYRSLVIPMAEKTSSDVTRTKFLFLGYRGLGNCYLAMSRFSEAEETFQKLFDYLPVWPGLDDSGYPINFESIAMARIGEQRWKAAEDSLQKAVTIFDDQIGEATHSGSDSSPEKRADKLRLSEDIALNLFAVVYFREQRYTDALAVLDRAYRQGTAFDAPRDVLAQIVDDGRAVSAAAGDADAVAIWSKRGSQAPDDSPIPHSDAN